MLTAPGLPAYQAFAAGIKGGKLRAGMPAVRLQAARLAMPLNSAAPAGGRLTSAGAAGLVRAAAESESDRNEPAALEGLAAAAGPAGPAVPGLLDHLKQGAFDVDPAARPETSEADAKAQAGEIFGEENSAPSGQDPVSAVVGDSGGGVTPPPSLPPAPGGPRPPTDPSHPPSRFKVIEEGSFFGVKSVERFLGFLGFRKLIAPQRQDAPPPLRRDSTKDEIIAYLAADLKTSREAVIGIAGQFGVNESGEVKDWWRVRNHLYNFKRDASYKPADHHVYEGFRNLENRQYAPGWKGAFKRALQVQKHIAGVLIRFPHHLFDMFATGYFRRSAAFEFKHSKADFTDPADPKSGERLLASALSQAKKRGEGWLGGLRLGYDNFRAGSFGRLIRPVLILIVEPLAEFMQRRLVMAVLGAVGMGLLGALGAAPFMVIGGMHLYSLSFAAIPVIGPGALAFAHGLPVFAGGLPIVGHLLAPLAAVAGAALTEFIKDMAVGPLLNTFLLATSLKLTSQKDGVKGALKAAVTRAFWWDVLKSWFMMVTVGAEIAGVLTYAAGVDDFVTAAGWKAVTGHQFNGFHMAASAIESSNGGVITWGNWVLTHAQGMVHLNISDGLMHLLNSDTAGVGAQDLFSHFSHPQGVDQDIFNFDRDLYKKSPEEIAARLKEVRGKAGGVSREIDATKKHLKELENEAQEADNKKAELEKESRPISPEDRAEYERLLKELDPKLAQAYIESKLAQGHDLKNPPPDDLAELKKLRELQIYYDQEGRIGEAAGDKAGFWDDLGVKQASLKALYKRISAIDENRAVNRNDGVLSRVSDATKAQINQLIDEIELMRGEFSAEATSREALTRLLGAQDKLRNLALHNRRGGKEVLDFRIEASKLAAFTDLAFAVKEINEARKVITEMQAFLLTKLDKIKAGHDANVQDKAAAEANSAKVGQWKADVDKDIKDDQISKDDMARFRDEADSAVTAIGSFQAVIAREIATINTEAGGDAEKIYQGYIDAINRGDLIKLRTEGNPKDPDAFSLKRLQSDLAEARGNIADAEYGVSKLGQADLEHIVILINAAPGPHNVTISPGFDKMADDLGKRRDYWQGKQDGFRKTLAYVERKLDMGNIRKVPDELGALNYDSAAYWRQEALKTFADAQNQTRALAAEIDGMAAQINSALGAAVLPPLSGGNLTQMQDSIKAYGDKLRAVKIPQSDDPNATQAQINVINIARRLPQAGYQVIRWSEADGALPILNDAVDNVLPQTRQMLVNLIGMLDKVKADVDADTAWAKNMKDPNFRANLDNQQAVVNRKNILLRDIILPPVREAERVIDKVLIPFQNKSIASAQPPGGDLFRLYDGKKTLITETKKLYATTVPWALASHGGPEGNVPESLAAIESWKSRLQRNITGYDDAKGQHHKGISEGLDEVAYRKGEKPHADENLYGEMQPYSVPAKIIKYSAERVSRAAQFNAQAAQINQILGRIETTSGGYYNLSAYRLPDITGDAAGAARMQLLVDQKLFNKIGDKLTAIGDDSKARGGGSGIDLVGSSGGPPTGKRDPITVSQWETIGLLARDAGVRVVPSAPESSPATFAAARLLFSDAVVGASIDARDKQIPKAETFLNRALKTIKDAIAQADNKDVPYVNSGGKSEPDPDQVYARAIANFRNLRDFLVDGVDFFNLKIQWDNDRSKTIDKANTYYSSVAEIYGKGLTVGDKDLEVWQKIHDALQKTADDLDAKLTKINRWIKQLSDPHESIEARTLARVSAIMDLTKAVAEANQQWHEVKEQLQRTDTILKAKATELEDKQAQLNKLLADPALQDALEPSMVSRIENLRLGRGVWAAGPPNKDADMMVVKKSQLSAFVDGVLSLWQKNGPIQNLDVIKQNLLNDPRALASLIPNSQIIDFSDKADGFYVVYQSRFSLPHGLENASQVTLGNIGRVLGRNFSFTGYQFGSPSNDENAPHGDKGVSLGVEYIDSKNRVDYMDFDLHRFAYDIPPEATTVSQAKQLRMRVFKDHVELLFGDKVYWGAAGFADFALDKTLEKPYYYGGVTKLSVKLVEVAQLKVEQQALWIKDPRWFEQPINLNFSGFDQAVDHDFLIKTHADNREFYKTTIGPSLDLGRLFNLDSSKGFNLDLFYSQTSGTDDISQRTLGAAVMNSFTLKNEAGKPWAVITNTAKGELGDKFNKLSDTLAVNLPDYGLVISAEGRILGDASTYYGKIAKKVGDNTTVSLGYGAPWVGMNNRADLTMNTSFTVRQLWENVMKRSRENLAGGEILQPFNDQLDAFYKPREGQKARETDLEIKRVWDRDMAGKLITQDMGLIFRDIRDLRQNASLMDNIRVSGMVGFVSSAVSPDPTERTVGGGPVAGTYSSLKLEKSDKALIAAKAPALFREGLRLQESKIERAKELQGLYQNLAQAQWEAKVARNELENAGVTRGLREQAEVRVAEAADRLHQAILAYNLFTGRDGEAPLPEALRGLNSSDLSALGAHVRQILSASDGLTQILHSLDKEQLEAALGPDPLNVMDFVPWVEKLTVSIGVQLQDMMANQFFTLGATLRLPLYDPRSKAKDKALVLERNATFEEMEQAYDDQLLRMAKELEQARLWAQNAETLRPHLPKAVADLEMAIRSFRNHLIGPEQIRAAFESWRWYVTTIAEADGKAALAQAWAGLDAGFARRLPRDGQTLRITSLGQAFGLVSRNSHSLAEVAQRQKGAAEMSLANDHRIQKAWVDLIVGAGLGATGLGWLPQLAITGVPVMPIPGFEFKPGELRELQVKGDLAQSEYYTRLRTKLEIGLAVGIYQNIVAYDSALKIARDYDDLIPKLRGKERDEAQLKREEAVSGGNTALATINYLLGRGAGSPLDIALTPDQALTALQELLKVKNPRENEEKLLAARVEIASSYQTLVEKDLKVEQLSVDPFSIFGRSLGRLIKALSDEDAGDADKAAAARIRTLSEQRARDNYPRELAVQAASAQAQLALVDKELEVLKDKSDAENRLKKTALTQKAYALKAALALAGEAQRTGNRPYENLPENFSQLKGRLRQKQQEYSAKPPLGAPEMPDSGSYSHQARSFGRYYYANQTLGRQPLNQHFAEGWLELRLKYDILPAAMAFKLSQLREQKADRLYHDALIKEAARADILAADFEADVQMLRWAKHSLAHPDGSAQGNLAEFILEKERRIDAGRNQIVALLGLHPKTSREDLMALVPQAPAGRLDPVSMSRAFLKEAHKAANVQLRQSVFEAGLPKSMRDEEDLIHQIKANLLAESFSFKGVNYIVADGFFRGTNIWALFAQAPDSKAIERGLENVISDVMRKKLETMGGLQELSLKLYSLSAGIRDGVVLIEAKRKAIEALEDEYQALMGGARSQAQFVSAEAARERVVKAWLDFAEQIARTKSDVIVFTSELEAIGLSAETRLRPAGSRFDEIPPLRRDPKRDLLAYWTDRFLDSSFESGQAAILDKLGPAVSTQLKATIAENAALLRSARRHADEVLHKDFSPAEKFEWLTRNDLQGKREALNSSLAQLLRDLGTLDKEKNPAWGELLKFLRSDIEGQKTRSVAERAQYLSAAKGLREVYWKIKPPPHALNGAFDRIEVLNGNKDEAWQALLESYMLDNAEDPTRFILKDTKLDDFLKAQAAFDAELVKTISSKEVRENKTYSWGLDGLYDIRGALARSIDGVRSRGMLALDALIMLEESRLAAAKWEARPQAEIDAIAVALYNLRQTKQRWAQGGASGLTPLYAVTSVSQDGKRLWTIDGWLTAGEFKAKKDAKEIVERDGRFYTKVKTEDEKFIEYEVLAGVDVKVAQRDEAEVKAGENQAVLDLHRTMGAHELALDRPDGQGRQGYSVKEIFGSGGKYGEGRVFFFEAPKKFETPGKLHKSLHPLTALAMSPNEYVIYLHEGGKAPPRTQFPTLESMKASEQAADFYQMRLSAQGVEAMVDRADENRAVSLRQGYLELKLNGAGFARDAQGAIVELYTTADDFTAARKGFGHAERDLKSAEAELEKVAPKTAESQAEAGRAAQLYQIKQVETRLETVRELKAEGKLDPAGPAFKLEEDKRFAKRFESYAKKYTETQQKYREAQALLVNAKKAVADAKKIQENSSTWSLYESRGLELTLDANGAVTHAQAQPVHGSLMLDESVGPPAAGETLAIIRGELFGAVMDGDRVKEFFSTREALEKAFENWKVKSITMKVDPVTGQPDDEPVKSADGRVTQPIYRVSHYEDAAGHRVLLNRQFIIDKVDSVKSTLWKTKNWGILPANWFSLIAEVPRAIIDTPIELITGRDPNQEHYLGRLAMYKTEGGSAVHYEFWGQVGGVIDIFNFNPDPVERALDLGFFPDLVRLNSRVLPEQDISGKKMTDVDGKRDYYFGVKAIKRNLAYTLEDLSSGRSRTLSRFHGGDEEILISALRGRGKPYEESAVAGQWGDEALRKTLADPMVADSQQSDGSGLVKIPATPGNLVVDRVEKRVAVRRGADQYDREAAALKLQPQRLREELEEAQLSEAGLNQQLEAAFREFKGSAQQRAALLSRITALWDEVHRRSWRIGAEDSLQRDIARWRERAAQLSRESVWWRDYLGRLQLAANPSPENAPPQRSFPFSRSWLWYGLLMILGPAAGWLVLRRRTH